MYFLKFRGEFFELTATTHVFRVLVISRNFAEQPQNTYSEAYYFEVVDIDNDTQPFLFSASPLTAWRGAPLSLTPASRFLLLIGVGSIVGG